MNKLGLVVGLMLFLGFSRSAGATDEIEAKLDGAYESLYISLYGLQYPPTLKVLDVCIRTRNLQCIQSYDRVQEAKKSVREVIARDEQRALKSTLNKIVVRCGGIATENDTSCIGAVIALYFFDKHEHQRPIMDALRKSGVETFDLVFYHHYPWFFNRPNPDEWIRYVKSLPDTLLPPMAKQITIQFFEDSKEIFEGFGVML